MSVEEVIKENIQKAVKKVFEIDLENVQIEHPENKEHGDYSTNISFILSKQLGKSPLEIGKEITRELEKIKFKEFKDVSFVPPGFINFKLSDEWLLGKLKKICDQKEKYGSHDIGGGNNIIVEYSNPNTNKPLHVGQARNNFIGSSLANILTFAGYKVTKSNYAGDIGIHICKSMLMYKKYGKGKEPDIKSDHFVGDFYIMFTKEVEKNPELEEEAKELLRKWEAGDKETVALWTKMNNWVYEGWKKTYEDQNVSFDIWEYESDNVNIGKEIVKEAIEKGVAEKDESGATIARLEKYGLPDKVLLRSDGTSIYATKDLQLAKDSFEEYNFDKRLYVVDYRQSTYFKQIFEILKQIGYSWVDRLYHIAYGSVNLPEGKMSSRTGNVVNSDDVFEQLIALEKIELEESSKEVSNVPETVKRVALAAFRFGMLKVDSSQNVIFDYNQVTKFEGNTGPYLLYTIARANSVLEKAGFECCEADLEKTSLSDQELSVLRSLYRFPEVVDESVKALIVHNIANYLFDLAQRFNTFYATEPILDSEDKDFRCALTHCTAQVLKNGLNLLGITPVDRM